MKVEKKIIGNLTKCYSLAPLHYQGKDYILVAAEKEDRCLLFDLDGNLIDTIWSEPGGTMSMVQIPGSNGQFLATHQFYSPNDSKAAKIVIVTPQAKGGWAVRTLTDLPHVHRFDIVERAGIRYLIACTLKSGHEYKEDWSMPGKVYAAVLPNDLSCFDENHQLPLAVIKDKLLKNHGFYKVTEDGVDTCIISADNGVFQFYPPKEPGKAWELKPLLDAPASDAVLVDLDEDGDKELVVISPFHGPDISIYKKHHGVFEKIYKYEKPAEFSHAIYGGSLCGRPAAVIGHRQGARNLMAFTWDKQNQNYQMQILDQDCGSTNVYHYVHQGRDIIISANREIDEIAMYTLNP